jgi:hypothetical protein
MIDADVPPFTGDDVSGVEPTYHWYARGSTPMEVTLSCDELPELIVDGDACG